MWNGTALLLVPRLANHELGEPTWGLGRLGDWGELGVGANWGQGRIGERELGANWGQGRIGDRHELAGMRMLAK